MRKYLLVIILLLSGCSVNLTVHDEDRAAQLVEKFLMDIQTTNGANVAYEWTNEQFKKSVPRDRFDELINKVRQFNSGAVIKIVGYETLGTEEVIIIYGISKKERNNVFYRFTLLGTKTKDYSLLNINLRDTEHKKGGLYREFAKPVEVLGV